MERHCESITFEAGARRQQLCGCLVGQFDEAAIIHGYDARRACFYKDSQPGLSLLSHTTVADQFGQKDGRDSALEKSIELLGQQNNGPGR